ncbi:MAG: hypothetical protein Q9208_005138 [Pyrenodesmia sp. 3 TL-2023]
MSLDRLSNDDHLPSGRDKNKTTSNDALQFIPRRGRLVALGTKAEIRHRDVQTIFAYIAEIPQKSTSGVLRAIDISIREHEKEPINLQHLKRVIKPEQLPTYPERAANEVLRIAIPTERTGPDLDLSTCPPEMSKVQDAVREESQATLYLFLCPTTSVPHAILSTLLNTLMPSQDSVIQTIRVPKYPPISSSQAEEWSQNYWPTVDRKYNPFGPQPSVIEKARRDILPRVSHLMGLALEAGKKVKERSMGLGIGAVIVERGESIVVAGDGRRVSGKFRAPDGGDKPARGQGNPMAHAVMRAIALVARKRRDLLAEYPPSVIGEDAGQSLSADTGWQEDRFLDKPLTALEREIYNGGSMKPGGYLCVDMDIYITHEPCIMCSMAILHSRFGNVVYGSRRVGTGALCAEREDIDIISGVDGPGRGLGYGLFWRQELNWRLLAWQWLDDDDDEYGYLEYDTHV